MAAPPNLDCWEANTFDPEIRYIPAIIRFLAYNPLPVASTLAAQLVRQRTALGMTRKESAKGLGVDPATLARWERGNRKPAGGFLGRVKRFIQEGQVWGERQAGSPKFALRVGQGSPSR